MSTCEHKYSIDHLKSLHRLSKDGCYNYMCKMCIWYRVSGCGLFTPIQRNHGIGGLPFVKERSKFLLKQIICKVLDGTVKLNSSSTEGSFFRGI